MCFHFPRPIRIASFSCRSARLRLKLVEESSEGTPETQQSCCSNGRLGPPKVQHDEARQGALTSNNVYSFYHCCSPTLEPPSDMHIIAIVYPLPQRPLPKLPERHAFTYVSFHRSCSLLTYAVGSTMSKSDRNPMPDPLPSAA
jgi:hypothetical protein